jgi:L-alanine-DL-glutamate epimerase-like enolase superfamily enzyme
MKITSVETLIPDLGLPRPFVFVQVKTDEGLTGLGQTADLRTAGVIHDFAERFLIGADPNHISRLWYDIYDFAAYHGYAGAESRALSAIDIALWDLKGQALGRPIADLLGGPVNDGVPTYNTCLAYGGVSDADRAVTDPVGLAQELIDSGYSWMKVTSFDPYAEASRGQYITPAEIDEAIASIKQVADAFGGRFQVAIEAHGQWAAGPATEIIRALDGLPIRWVEDPLVQDNVAEWVRLRDRSTVPIAGGERLQTRHQLAEMLRAGGVDVLISDITWAGGISEARRIAELADVAGVSFASHGNSGPVNLWSAAHVLAVSRNACAAEVVRVHLLEESGYYGQLVDVRDVRQGGKLVAPTRPGLGFALPEGLPVLSRQVTDAAA